MWTRRRGPHYLLRFDDLCPTMDWSTWNPLEELLLRKGLKPILAVIPDNQDPRLKIDPPAPDFWDRVRAWQARGWAIGLHGYQHLYVNAESGIMKFPKKSEFAGLSYAEQLEKVRLGVEIFAREGVNADAWIAPSHSFDWVTVAALRELGIHTISDGLALRPYRDALGNVWIPQQSGRMRALPWGVWTFCYHLDDFQGTEWLTFTRQLERLRPRMISLAEARAMGDRAFSLADGVVGWARAVVSAAKTLRVDRAR